MESASLDLSEGNKSASHFAHTFIHGVTEAMCLQSPFLWAINDSWEPIRGRILHNIQHNTSMGILAVCSGWEQWSVCWSENNPSAQPEAAENVGNMRPAAEKNAAHKPLHQQKIKATFFKKKKKRRRRWTEETQWSSYSCEWTI